MSWILTKLKGDKMIWILVFIITLVSVLALYSAGSAQAFRIYGGDTEGLIMRHVFLLVVGLCVIFVVHLVDYRIFARLSNVLLLITIPLLIGFEMMSEAKPNLSLLKKRSNCKRCSEQKRPRKVNLRMKK